MVETFRPLPAEEMKTISNCPLALLEVVQERFRKALCTGDLNGETTLLAKVL